MSDAVGPSAEQPSAEQPSAGQPPARDWLLLLGAVAAVAVCGANPLLFTPVLVAMFVAAPPRGMKILPTGVKAVGLLYLPFALVWLGLTIGYLRVCEALGSPVAPQALLEQLGRDGLNGDGWLYVLLIVVLAPVAEEILFRGYLFTALRSVLPPLATHLLTATLFGLVHGLGHALPIGMLSLLFGYLRSRYGSLLPAVLAHSLHNGTTLLLVLTWPEFLDLFYNR